jgi:hypothetical protein
MLTPDPMGGRSDGANLRLDACDFEIAPDMRASTLVVGRDAHPVVVLDGVLRAPRAIADFAATHARFSPSVSGANYYPNMRAPAPQPYGPPPAAYFTASDRRYEGARA